MNQQRNEFGEVFDTTISDGFLTIKDTMILEKTTSLTLPELPAFSGKEFDTKGFYIWSNFKTHFLTKKEAKSPGGKFKISRLTEPSIDPSIIEELGKDAEVTLSELYEFLKTADKSGSYIAYIRDTENTLWAVICSWYSVSACWGVEADTITHPGRWFAGRQFFSRDSEISELLDSENSISDPLTLGDKVEVNGRSYIAEDKLGEIVELREMKKELRSLANKLEGYLRSKK